MKSITIILLLVSGAGQSFGQESATLVEADASVVAEAKPISPDLDAIRDASQSFVDAFNHHDANAVAALWTKDGEYIDGAGRVLVGRDEISKDYHEYFAANPEAKITIVIDSLRLLSSDTAIEDGRAAVESSAGNTGLFATYTVVHAKVNGHWMMASVRDETIEPQASATSAADLEWLVGKWVAEEHGVTMESDCRWVVDGRFIQRTYTTTQVDGSKSSGVQLIGWNPDGGHVQSWDFSPDGGHAVGTWMPQEGGWSAHMRGVTGDGTLTNAINQLRRLDDSAYVWQSIQRTAGGMVIPDTDEVVLKRIPVAR
ncbi:SgcJ/EcaC family oxidoreductase [Stieleria varia]